jgi:GT2 family glycosyltransferase
MITVVLTGYKRPYTLEAQIRAVRHQTIKPKRIMLWYNYSPETQQKLPPNIKGVDVIQCNFNAKFHGRFAAALLADTEYIAIFDDDTIPGQKWFANCLQ